MLSGRVRAPRPQEFTDPAVYNTLFDWLVCYQLAQGAALYDEAIRSGKDEFAARNGSQVYALRDLSLLYIERLIIRRFLDNIDNAGHDRAAAAALRRLCDLYALWAAEKHLGVLFEGGHFTSAKQSKALKSAIVGLCAQVKVSCALRPTFYELVARAG